MPSPLAHARSIQPQFAERLVRWQQQHGRHDLPWQQNRTPYRVWVSEIMLQQTQVATVKSYFLRFMQRFPSVQSLAAADEDTVLALWAGLGYYSRARNLWRCARLVTDEYQGRFPRTAEALAQLPGIGPSTAAAIASICFGERVSILDANAQRVLTRVLCFQQPVRGVAVRRELQHCANALLPAAEQQTDADNALGMQAYTQALMDLGSAVCTATRPQCTECPADSLCLARAENLQSDLPVKTRPAARKTEVWHFVWLEHDHAILLAQRTVGSGKKNRIWNGLWCFPQLPAARDLQPFLSVCSEQAAYTVEHHLTHRKLHLHISRLSVPDREQAEQLLAATGADADASTATRPICDHPISATDAGSRLQWVDAEALQTLGLPAPVAKLLRQHRG